MIVMRRREKCTSKITVPTSYWKFSRARRKTTNNSHGNRCAPVRSRPVRLSSVGGKHGRVAALTSVTARPAVQDGRDCVLAVVTSMAENNTGKGGIRTTLSSSKGRGITPSAGVRHQPLSQLQTATSNATTSDNITTHDTRNKTKRKALRRNENFACVETGAQQTLSGIVDSDDISTSARPAAEGSSHSDHEETVDADPETEELAKLRCPSERTEVIAEREARRRQRRCADYPGFAFGSSIFGSDTIMKFNIIRNELQNIKNSQLKRVSTHGFPISMIFSITDQLMCILCGLAVLLSDDIFVSCRNVSHVTGRGGASLISVTSHLVDCTLSSSYINYF